MRVITALVPLPALLSLTLVPSPVLAKAKVHAPAAPTESAAARAARLAQAEDVGEHRDTELRAQGITTTQVATGDGAHADRGPADATAQPVRPSGPLAGGLEALVARQLDRQPGPVAQVGRCLAEARARDAQLPAEVDVTIKVTAKAAHLARPQGDASLACCLAAVQGLKLSVPDQAFTWRFGGGGDHREMVAR